MFARASKSLAIATVACAITVASAQSQPTGIIGPVASGDTLTQIAERVAPAGRTHRDEYLKTLAALYQLNADRLPNGVRSLQVGAMLQMPSPEQISNADPSIGAQILGGRNLPRVDPAFRAGSQPAVGIASAKTWPPSDSQGTPAANTSRQKTQPAPIVDGRKRPGARRAPPPEQFDPNRQSGLEPVPSVRWGNDPSARAEKVPVPDRWRLLENLDLLDTRWWDPYRQNTLKADRPIVGKDWFLNVSFISDTVIEPRSLPTPVGNQTTNDAGDIGVFGSDVQLVFAQTLLAPWVFYKGNTTFKPPDHEFRLTPVIQYNRVEVDERRALRIDPREGTVRSDNFFAIQEAFYDKHLRNVSDRYDFDSFRIGIQPFNADFRGFLFQDIQLGARLFGNRDDNKWQYNLAWFRRLEKDTNSGLNDVGEDLRKDDVIVANVYRQDWPVLGYFSQATIVHNRNREGDEGSFFDTNGFIARPASLGGERPRNYDVTYLGYNGDGHIGRLNLTIASYLAIGDESVGTFSPRERDIFAGFFAAELSRDFDWIRLRYQIMYASPDEDPFDDEANGFDAIFENPIFAGADTSYWMRQNVPLIAGGAVTLNVRNGLINNLRPNKEHGQSNFANPGTGLAGVGADLDLTPQLRLSFNFNYLSFIDTTILEVARNQADIGEAIGLDASAAVIWRPLMTQNIIVRLSAAGLFPGEGFRDLFPDEDAYSVLANIVLTY